MPLSKAKKRAYNKAHYARKKAGGTALLPKALVRELHRLGVNPYRYLTVAPVSLDAYRDMERRLEAKAERVGWQSSFIASLRAELATLKAVAATKPAMGDGELAERVLRLETDAVLRGVLRDDYSTFQGLELP